MFTKVHLIKMNLKYSYNPDLIKFWTFIFGDDQKKNESEGA